MKVLQINSVCGKGSTGKIVNDIFESLEVKGIQCKIAYGRGEAIGVEAKNLIYIGNTYSVNAHALLSRITDKAGFYSNKATKQLICEIEKYNPDVIHLHNIHGYYLNIEILFDYLATVDKKVIWTLHDCWSFTGHCAYFDGINCAKWKRSCCRCEQKKTYPKSFILDNSKQNYEKKKQLFTKVKNMTIVTPSQWLADVVRESFLCKYPIQVIANGVDLSKICPVESKFRSRRGIENRYMILGVANIWDERKGMKDFLQLREMLGESYQIVLVGLTARQVRALPSSIMGITRTTNLKELLELYSTADVFVNPTYEDNFPTTNIEALACGTPVITYRTGGSPESIDTKSGIVVDKGDVEALYQAIVQQCEEKIIQKADCLKRSEEYDKKKKYAEYIELYKTN